MTIASSTQQICFLVLSTTLVLGSLAVVLLPSIVYSAFLLGAVFLSVAGLYLLLNASFVAAAQILVYVGAVNVLILFAIMLVNKREPLTSIPGLIVRRLLSGGVCIGLFALLLRVAFTTRWALPGPLPVGEEATIRIGEHFFSDYLLPFELASVLLLMAMIGAIVLARRDVFSTDVITGEPVDQGLIEKARTPLLLEQPVSGSSSSSTLADSRP
jgi:NAD(P)H-quinone oxidoreductase subunit 6